MTKISVMSDALANKIAAGEVIERVSSVVKELLENSIDAGAKDIKITLVNSGIKKIEVTDDGCGMDKSDALLCFQRHATSKIKKDDDLFFINTLGFRGEALASIASVSNVTLKTNNKVENVKLCLSAGNVISESFSSGRVGTSISIEDIFFNTPARLKFLKSESSELSSSVSLIEKMSMCNPQISFTLKNNDKVILKTSGSGDLLKTIHEIYGVNLSSSMLKLKCFDEDFYVEGYVSKPEVMKNNKNHFITFVNGRLVKSYEVNKAVNDAYHTYKPVDKFPVIVINIEIDPTLIDVNIHPSKQVIKISKSTQLCNLIYENVKKVLSKTLLIPEIKEEIQFEEYFENPILEENSSQLSLNFKEAIITEKEEVKSINDFKLYPVGLVHGTYIVAQNENGMYLIDQHAAAERINYEKYLENLKKTVVNKKGLLVPINVEFTKSDFIKFLEKSDEFKSLGFDFEIFGESSILIKAHPDYLRDGVEEESVNKIINIVLTSNYDRVKFNEHVAITLACKMSIKANTCISFKEMEYFLDNIVKCDNPYTCPHGRPTIIKYTIYDLEKLFLRSK